MTWNEDPVRVSFEPVTCGHYAVVDSQVLGETRRLLIYLPKGHGDGGQSYPLLIQLDGEPETFCQAAMAVWYLAHMAERIPEHVLVAIENTDRGRDMGLERGADDFLRFIEHELVPFAAARYRASGTRILCGQSASSVFAGYAFVKRPRLFDGCVLSSFGLGEGDRACLEGLLPDLGCADLPFRHLFATNAQSDPYDVHGTRAGRGQAFLEALAQTDHITLRYQTYQDEGHVPYPSLYDGLKWIYRQIKQ